MSKTNLVLKRDGAFVKKIAFLVLHLGFGGAERAVVSEANLLCEFCEVEIISFYKLYEKPAFNVNPKIKITYLTEGLAPNRDELRAAIKAKNLSALIKEGFKSAKILYLRRFLMKKAIKKLKVDIAVSTRRLYHKMLTGNIRKGTVCIAQEHNHHNGDEKYIKKLINSVCDMDYFMPVSKELNDFYSARVIGKVRCRYIPHHLEYIPEAPSSLTRKNIASIGRLSKEKGMDDLVKVFSLVSEKHPDWMLHIVGDGDCRPALEAQIQQAKLDSKIVLHGFKNREEINSILSNSSIYVMTSHTESFGLVIIEAQSFGIPCVAFDSARGALETIADKENGIIIKNRSISNMADAISLLINDYAYRCALGRAAEINAEKYSLETVKLMWKAFIDTI